jgi:CBS domain-containing protein
MKVRDAMMGTPISCSPDTNLGAAIELLWNNNCGILPIVDANQKVTGLVTDRDLCIALGTRNRLPGAIPISEVATGQVYSCEPEDDIHSALETMAKYRVRRLPVVNKEGALEGILSMDNVVLHAEHAALGHKPELSNEDIVDTLQRIYGPQRPLVAKFRTAAS